MQPIKQLLTIFFLLFLSSITILSQIYDVIVTGVSVNGLSIPKEQFNDIIISSQDTISFVYELYDGGKQTTKPFLYNLSLWQGDEEFSKTSGFTVAKFGPELQEGDYKFGVEAFDLAGEWKTTINYYSFKVNNLAAGLIADNRKLTIEKKQADSVIAEYKKTLEEHKGNIPIVVLYGGIGVFSVVIILLILLVLKNNKIKHSTDVYKKEAKDKAEYFSKLEQQLREAARQEIDVLKSKMDLMTSKFEGISSLNSSFAIDVQNVKDSTNKLATLQYQKNTMFTDIVQGVSNPINTIKLLVELLRNYDLNAVETSDVINNIIETSLKIIDISDNIQRLAEFATSDFELQFDLTDVDVVVRDAINKNISEAKKRNININVDISPEVHSIRIDQQKIMIVLHNLINNAVKFTSDNGMIAIAVFNKNGATHFEVTDTGVGIDQASLLKIYKNMEADLSQTRINTDDTIGLLTVKKYVEAHNGKVMVSSMLGKGSTFSFNIPLT